MKDLADSDLNQRIAQRVRGLRQEQSLSLEELAACSGVSRSMISVIERGESSPTAVVLEKLATGLGTTLAGLFAPAAAMCSPVARLADQPPWTDPASGYVRRNVSPGGWPSPIQIVEVSFPAGARVAYETGPRQPVVHQQIWVLDGRLEVTVGEQRHTLATGDCLALVLDQPLTYFNPTRKPVRYAVVLATSANHQAL